MELLFESKFESNCADIVVVDVAVVIVVNVDNVVVVIADSKIDESVVLKGEYRVYHAKLDKRKRWHSASKSAKVILKKDSKST